MKKKHTAFLTMLFLLSMSPSHSFAEEFKAMAAPYPPFTVSKGLEVTGISPEVLKAIMTSCGMPMDDEDFYLTPWAYAYEYAAREPDQVVLNAQRTEANEHLYKWVGPVITCKTVLIGKRWRHFSIENADQLNQYRIATVRWSRPEKALLAEGAALNSLHRCPTHVEALRELQKDEIDLFTTTLRGAPQLMQGLGLKLEDYKVCYTLTEEPLYFAFSKQTDDAVICRLNAALEGIKTEGTGWTHRFSQMTPNRSVQHWLSESD